MLSMAVREENKTKLIETKAKIQASLSLFSSQPREYKHVDVNNYEPDPTVHDDTCRAVLERSLSQTDKALDIIENHPGNYGKCEKCGRKIFWERMMVLPQATRCVKCSSPAKNNIIIHSKRLF